MDAANYISTLDSLDLLAQEPSRANFAVIDLAVDDRFLRFLYEADQHGSVQWWSLLENTRWQASWNQGPILLAFNGDTQFQKKIKERLSSLPLGIVIDSPESSTCVFNWAQGWLLAPKTENIVAIRKIFLKSAFFEITIGITITSGGIGKNELSTNDTIAK